MELNLDVTKRLIESYVYPVKSHPKRKILELDRINSIEALEPSIQRLVQMMLKFKDVEGTIFDICSKIKLDIESSQQFNKTISRNRER